MKTKTSIARELATFGVVAAPKRAKVTHRITTAGGTYGFSIYRDGEGRRIIWTPTEGMVPVEIASLAAGRTAWMRKIPFRCHYCGIRHALENLYVGRTLACAACAESKA